MAHVRIFIQIFTLIAGAGVLLDSRHMYRDLRYPFLKSLMVCLLFLNMGVLVSVVSHYMSVNFFDDIMGYKASGLPKIMDPLEGVFFVAMVYAFIRFSHTVREKSIARWISVAFIVMLGFSVLNILSYFLAGKLIIFSMGAFWGEIVLLVIVIWALAALVEMLLKSRRLGDENKTRIFSPFSLFYLAMYIALIGTKLVPHAWAQAAGTSVVLLMVVYPSFWYRHYLLRFGNALPFLVGEADLNALYDKYSVSSRQREIAALLLHGKSNRDIAEKLFIAPHTVKNHIYSLYQKLGVKSRYELVNFFLEAVKR